MSLVLSIDGTGNQFVHSRHAAAAWLVTSREPRPQRAQKAWKRLNSPASAAPVVRLVRRSNPSHWRNSVTASANGTDVTAVWSGNDSISIGQSAGDSSLF